MNMREEADSLSLQDTIKLVIVRSGLEAHDNAEEHARTALRTCVK